jgi:hypothetical protein
MGCVKDSVGRGMLGGSSRSEMAEVEAMVSATVSVEGSLEATA